MQRSCGTAHCGARHLLRLWQLAERKALSQTWIWRWWNLLSIFSTLSGNIRWVSPAAVSLSYLIPARRQEAARCWVSFWAPGDSEKSQGMESGGRRTCSGSGTSLLDGPKQDISPFRASLSSPFIKQEEEFWQRWYITFMSSTLCQLETHSNDKLNRKSEIQKDRTGLRSITNITMDWNRT